MMTKLSSNGTEPTFETKETLVFSHVFSEKDLAKIDTFLRVQKQTGTLTINYNLGGKTRVHFVQTENNEHVKL